MTTTTPPLTVDDVRRIGQAHGWKWANINEGVLVLTKGNHLTVNVYHAGPVIHSAAVWGRRPIIMSGQAAAEQVSEYLAAWELK